MNPYLFTQADADFVRDHLSVPGGVTPRVEVRHEGLQLMGTYTLAERRSGCVFEFDGDSSRAYYDTFGTREAFLEHIAGFFSHELTKWLQPNDAEP